MPVGARVSLFSETSIPALELDYFLEIKRLEEDIKNLGVSHRTENSEGQIFGRG
jgi:hypothetical protein